MNDIIKKLNKEIVKEFALALMFENLTINSTQVKDALKKKGYDVRQENINKMMSEIAQEELWNYTTKDKYKVYWK